MKHPTDVSAIIAGVVYTVPTYTNVNEEKVNGKNATIKFYNEASSEANAGVDPISLVKVLMDYFQSRQKVTKNEEIATGFLEDVYDILLEDEDEDEE